MDATISKSQAQTLGRVIVRYGLYCTPEETAAFLETPEGRKIQALILEYQKKMGYKPTEREGAG